MAEPVGGPTDKKPEMVRPEWDAEPDAWERADRDWNRPWKTVESEGDVEPLPADYQPAKASAGNVSRAYGNGMREAGPYLGLGAQIGAAMIFFVGVGVFVDRWLDSSPWGVLVGASLGMIGIIALVVRLAKEGHDK